MASDPTVLALRQFESLTCILPDCGAELAVVWDLVAPLVLGELEPDADPLSPGDAIVGDWHVRCANGHVILVPGDKLCPGDGPLCSDDLCDGDHREELREWRRWDVERLRALLRSAGKLPGEDAGHVVEFRETGWTLKHPLACRPNLFDCPINRLAEVELREPPDVLGRFEVSVNDLGDRLLIGDRIGGTDG